MEEKSYSNLVDTHAHLASAKFSGQVEEIIDRASEANVGRIVSIACDLEDSRANLQLSQEFECVRPTVGIHPLYVDEIESDNWISEIRELALNKDVVAIGEIGLDYFHAPPNGLSDVEWRSRQLTVFEAQLQISVDLDLPVVIHQRNSADDVTAVLRQFPAARAVLHCFTGTVTEAETALEMGHLLSFTGILTFPNAPEVRDAARIVPLDRVMVETDAPYLSPAPFRGRRCEPR